MHDVVIIGGGIAGSSLGSALASAGLSIVILEASGDYQDRVKGESLLPWGVKEARNLGVEQVLLSSGARDVETWVQYASGLSAEESEANPIPMSFMVPDVSGSLNIRHPMACSALSTAADIAGAEVIRGVTDISVAAGDAPLVSFQSNGKAVELTARLIVGADGRNSTVRKQAGITLQKEREINMISGLLLEGFEADPSTPDFLASEGDLFMAAFHQEGGQIRIYLCPGLSQRHRFSGGDGVEAFRNALDFECIPFAEQLGNCRPAGPIATYPGDSTWTERPFAPGVVLIGDAAGHLNPIIGEGLSAAMRDARMVRDSVLEDNYEFTDYATERLERMRRLRFGATLVATAHAADGPDRDGRRARFFQLQQTEPVMLGLLASMMGGPETGPAEAFDGSLLEFVLSWLVDYRLWIDELNGYRPRVCVQDDVDGGDGYSSPTVRVTFDFPT